MGSRPNWRFITLELRHADEVATAIERRQCDEAVLRWNERVRIASDPDPSPTIGVALVAGRRWLSVLCPGCLTISAVDIEAIDRHRRAPVSTLIPSLRCRQCGPHARMVRLLGLATTREAAMAIRPHSA